ncbi:MAG: cysteine--tRNA ligase [Nitrososphaerales archaeon]
MTLRLYNTLGRRIEEFKPLQEGLVKIYTCGPTVYDYAHIGNFRTFVFQDLLRRYLKYKGYSVFQVQNLTDVDDKTIKASREQGVSLREYTNRYIQAYFQDIDTLGIERAEVYPRATEHIADMVSLIKKLLDLGIAYFSEGSVYYRVSAFKDYGKLSGIKGELKAERIKADEYSKEEIRDFALWKSWDEEDGEVFWLTELGKGRPGWHIECSAMSMKYLGETFDIHSGGVDLIFPHHENEIAQSEAATGKLLARYWVHCEHLLVNGQKMAKSLGNYFTLRELLARQYTPSAIRFLLLSAHYRDRLNFTFDGLAQAETVVRRLQDFSLRLTEAKPISHEDRLVESVKEYKDRFEEAMDNDLNSPTALAVFFEFVKEVNKKLDEGKVSQNDLEYCRAFLNTFNSIFNVIPSTQEDRLEPELQALIEQRQEARRRKDWATADKIRDELSRRGIQLEDTPQGVKWRRVKRLTL